MNAINMLAEDAFTLQPGRYMQEAFGSCKAKVSNNGWEPKKFYRDSVTLEFDDILLECVHYNSHPGGRCQSCGELESTVERSMQGYKQEDEEEGDLVKEEVALAVSERVEREAAE
ncbi:hypothetical protein L7F22_012309 [Adiantum nelumboides]|nr:hypothetical protein [Adiantum nelumboides]